MGLWSPHCQSPRAGCDRPIALPVTHVGCLPGAASFGVSKELVSVTAPRPPASLFHTNGQCLSRRNIIVWSAASVQRVSMLEGTGACGAVGG